MIKLMKMNLKIKNYSNFDNYYFKTNIINKLNKKNINYNSNIL